jgi:TetR/AcrR family transcriptional repressor of nem operon
MGAFWGHGYTATSITDLMDATGLAKGSLYKGFGDKKQLFMLALESYLTHAQRGLGEVATRSATGREALEQIFGMVVELATVGGLRRGCLSVNSSIELGPHDPEVRNRLRQNTRQKEKTFSDIIGRGIRDGSLRRDLDPDVAARYITTVSTGLQVQGKIGLTEEQAREAVAMAMTAFV